jgi:hypothetical protein
MIHFSQKMRNTSLSPLLPFALTLFLSFLFFFSFSFFLPFLRGTSLQFSNMFYCSIFVIYFIIIQLYIFL